MSLNYYIGQIINHLGYKIVPTFKYPQNTINIVEIGCALLRAKITSPTNIIQIGAFDGKLSDPLVNILTGLDDINVLLVEPQQKPFEDLIKAYDKRPHFILVNAAVTEKDGLIEMFIPKAEEASPKASLSKSHFRKFSISNNKLRSIEVEGLTVKSLLARSSFNTVDILQIDTEGHDYKILKQFFALNIFPKIINLESFHLDKKQRKGLRDDLSLKNYLFVDLDYDTFSIHKSVLNNFQ